MTLWVVVFSMLVAAYFAGSAERKKAGPARATVAAAEETPANGGALEDSARVTEARAAPVAGE